MKITKITTQVKNKDRTSIYIDGEYSFSLSQGALLDAGLYVGIELDSQQIRELRTHSEMDKLYGRTLELISRRLRSRWEIEEYLRRKDTPSEVANELLNKLSNKGYIDDQEFARRWVENRRLLKSVSKRKLALELKQKRISESIIQNVLRNDEADEKQILAELIRKKRSQSRYQDDQKLIRYLASQGFQYGDIKDALAVDDTFID